MSCSPEPRKLESSQAENRSGIWTTGLTCLRPPAHKVTLTVNREGIRLLDETAVDVWEGEVGGQLNVCVFLGEGLGRHESIIL